jgi:hypothetical protein
VFAGESGTYSFAPGGTFTGLALAAACFSGRNASEPSLISVGTNGALGGNASPVSIPLTGGTPAANDDLRWFGAVSMTNGGTWTQNAPSGMTARETQSNLGTIVLAFASQDAVAATPTGTLTGSVTAGTGTAGGDSFGVVLSLAQASGVAGQPPMYTQRKVLYFI